MRRPHGFLEFTERQGFHCLYLVTTESGAPVKVGIAVDPAQRLASIQSSNFIPLRLHRFWWLPGRLISARIETAFKRHFGARCIRGEWFDVSLSAAEEFIAEATRNLGTWGVTEGDVVGLMDHYARRRFSVPAEAPSPLRGVPESVETNSQEWRVGLRENRCRRSEPPVRGDGGDSRRSGRRSRRDFLFDLPSHRAVREIKVMP